MFKARSLGFGICSYFLDREVGKLFQSFKLYAIVKVSCNRPREASLKSATMKRDNLI
jgi:hypothetical protein